MTSSTDPFGPFIGAAQNQLLRKPVLATQGNLTSNSAIGTVLSPDYANLRDCIARTDNDSSIVLRATAQFWLASVDGDQFALGVARRCIVGSLEYVTEQLGVLLKHPPSIAAEPWDPPLGGVRCMLARVGAGVWCARVPRVSTPPHMSTDQDLVYGPLQVVMDAIVAEMGRRAMKGA